MPKFFYIGLKDNREDVSSSEAIFPEKIQFLLQQVGSGKKVLDVGCNDGYIGELLLKNHNDVYGFDIVKKKLLMAQKRGLKVKEHDIEKKQFPYDKESFDMVILGDVIEHVFDTDALLVNCKRVLKKGGKLIITTPNVASFGRRIMLLFGINPFLEYSSKLSPINGYPAVGHIRYYTLHTLKKQLMYNGFIHISICGNGLNLFFLKLPLATGYFFSSLCTYLFCISEKK